MAEKANHTLKRLTEKLYGGLPMSWPAVILYALGSAVLTAFFLIVPVFKNTSFQRMGETMEAWVFFAVIIMANCKTPAESARKTFAFFLFSQPLIYLFQVPFSWQGWHLFAYYPYWLIWTILTIPMAFAGWYINKKNWLSLLILTPVLFALTEYSIAAFRFSFRHFPLRLVTAVFCLAQVLLYLYVFTSNLRQKLLGFVLPAAAVLVLLLMTPELEINAAYFLPDNPILTDAAIVTVEDAAIAEVSIAETGEDSMIHIHSTRYGVTSMAIQDGEREYRYTLKIYEDDQGAPQIGITTETAGSVLTPDPVSETESAEPPEIVTETGRQDGERFEDVILMEGMEETVHYEHIRNDSLGFEMDYDYELFVRYTDAGRERFVSAWDDQENPENYLDITYSAEDAESVSASIGEALSEDYEIIKESYQLDHAGSCTRIGASEIKGGGFMPDLLQMVYIIPAADGCRIAAAHYTIEAAEGFGTRFSYIVNTLTVIERNRESTLSDEQALSAVKNYCYIGNPGLEDIVNAGEHAAGWEISSSGEQEVVVLFRSYTGALIRYYIDRASGDAYVTEFVPGISTEEDRTDERFNVRDYL